MNADLGFVTDTGTGLARNTGRSGTNKVYLLVDQGRVTGCVTATAIKQ